MERIVNRDLLEGIAGGGYDLVQHPLGHGHFEAQIRPIVTWGVVDQLSDEAYAAYLVEREATAAERKERNLERACQRAKTRVRRLCKLSGVDTLLTLTYQANMTDFAQLKVHMKAFNRKMSKLVPGWLYVAAFERQDRGAWHVHMAVRRLPSELLASNGVKVKSFNVVRAVWRSVTGEMGGNIDVQARKRNSQRAPSRIAAYLSKYMLKAFADGEAWSNRYSSSTGLPAIPRPIRTRFEGWSLPDVMAMMLHDLPSYESHQLSWGLNKFKDGAWLIIDTNIKHSLWQQEREAERYAVA